MISKAELESMGCVFWMPSPKQNIPDLIGGGVFDTLKLSDTTICRIPDGNKISKFSNSCMTNSSTITGLNVTGSISVGCWINPLTAPLYTFLLRKTGSSGIQLDYGITINDGNIVFATSANLQSTPYTLSLNELSFVVFTFDQSNIRTYIDGVLVSTDTAVDSITNKSDVCWLGSAYNGNYPFDGYLNNLMVFNSVLTSEQIEYIYKKTFIR